MRNGICHLRDEADSGDQIDGNQKHSPRPSGRPPWDPRYNSTIAKTQGARALRSFANKKSDAQGHMNRSRRRPGAPRCSRSSSHARRAAVCEAVPDTLPIRIGQPNHPTLIPDPFPLGRINEKDGGAFTGVTSSRACHHFLVTQSDFDEKSSRSRASRRIFRSSTSPSISVSASGGPGSADDGARAFFWGMGFVRLAGLRDRRHCGSA
jgi:hypothetical protein